ncbi:DUF6879 family protein [Nocardia noduli]|uniref:DUF6879 family protein n=1 Tax=Nocardia noduli TaxID=2815722 RepID=UPI0034D46A6E
MYGSPPIPVPGLVLAFNLVDSDGRPAGAAITTDDAILDRYRAARQHLWALATPFENYAVDLHAQQ